MNPMYMMNDENTSIFNGSESHLGLEKQPISQVSISIPKISRHQRKIIKSPHNSKLSTANKKKRSPSNYKQELYLSQQVSKSSKAPLNRDHRPPPLNF